MPPEKIPEVKKIARLYYANPKIQEALFTFARNREVAPSYMMQAFGKRPDALQYPSDVVGLANKGATSFHCSEELWTNPLEISSDMRSDELAQMRQGWDLLIDIDSPYLDFSKIAAQLIIQQLEKYGITHYGLKFSGSKGFHLVVPFKAFPPKLNGIQTALMFPEWPRAISEFLLNEIRPAYNKIVSEQDINFKALEQRTKLKKEDITTTVCPNCNNPSQKLRKHVTFQCNRCKNVQERPNYIPTKRVLKCIDPVCPGTYDILEQKDYFYCEKCNTSSMDKRKLSSGRAKGVFTKAATSASTFTESVSGEAIASLDLVLVASRHLFRMPYSLHEKTALASIVITKDELKHFSPRSANPLKLSEIKEFYPANVRAGEGERLLAAALAWKQIADATHDAQQKKMYENYEPVSLEGVTEEMFPQPIKKLLKGLKDGRKRGAFILLTFLRSCNFSPEYITKTLYEWNKKNDPPLKEGYLKSQIEWHLKQTRKILPPNYSNKSYYKDLQLLDREPTAKNPISEVTRVLRRQAQN